MIWNGEGPSRRLGTVTRRELEQRIGAAARVAPRAFFVLRAGGRAVLVPEQNRAPRGSRRAVPASFASTTRSRTFCAVDHRVAAPAPKFDGVSAGIEFAPGAQKETEPMTQYIEDTPEDLRAQLARDHRELELLFEELTSALRADARDDTLRLWAAFDDGLSRHMALEEKYILPQLEQHDAREVAALSREHEQICMLLAELGVGVDLHEVPVQTIKDFIQRLREHAQREDALAYRWAEANLRASEKQRIGASLGVTSALRQRRLELARKAKASVASER